MRLMIRRLTIDNFKSIEHFVVEFNEKVTEIAGRNETGKTTVADAFFFALFGKDSNFRSKFDIIPLDKNNSQIHNLETSVELEFSILNPEDGVDKEYKIKRVLSENWVKKRGTGEDKELKGTTTDLFINDAPVKLSEYNEFVSAIISEEKFKLLTSTTYFNVQMSWQERRKILTSLIENVSYEDIVKKPEYQAIRFDVIQNGIDQTESKYKHQLTETKKTVSDLPTRIDEASKSINRDVVAGVEDLKEQRDSLYAEIDRLKKKSNEEYVSRCNEIREQINQLGKEISEMENSVTYHTHVDKERDALVVKKKTVTDEITTINQEIKTLSDRIDTSEAGRKELKDAYIELSAHKYEPTSTTCPTCGQELPENEKQKARAKYEEVKTTQLANYRKQAGELKETTANLTVELSNKRELLKTKASDLQGICHALELSKPVDFPVPEKDVVNNALIEKRQKKIDLENDLGNVDPNPYKDKIFGIDKEIDLISTQLAGYETSEKAKVRVAELEAKLKTANTLLLEIEKNIDLVGKLKLEYVNTVEGDINKMFDRKIKIRLFESQINGGFRETCDILYQNRAGSLVPYQSVNTAGQINSSLQIINLLSKHMDIYCPVFIDHAESVETLFKIDSQMIELTFKASYPALTVK